MLENFTFLYVEETSFKVFSKMENSLEPATLLVMYSL
jgi:hypothetical protein